MEGGVRHGETYLVELGYREEGGREANTENGILGRVLGLLPGPSSSGSPRAVRPPSP